MIGRIQGTLIEKQPSLLVVDVGGIGYEVEVSFSTSFALKSIGEQVVLHTHFVVREDAQLLFGFASRADRDLFRMLIKVNGVGPKLALAILSGLDAPHLARCIDSGDVATLVKLPGIGKKTAERLVLDMRDKVKAWLAPDEALPLASTIPEAHAPDAVSEAQAALEALGYKAAESAKAIKALDTRGKSSEELIRLALRNMMKVR